MNVKLWKVVGSFGHVYQDVDTTLALGQVTNLYSRLAAALLLMSTEIAMKVVSPLNKYSAC